jgi:hypothetical protein
LARKPRPRRGPSNYPPGKSPAMLVPL